LGFDARNLFVVGSFGSTVGVVLLLLLLVVVVLLLLLVPLLGREGGGAWAEDGDVGALVTFFVLIFFTKNRKEIFDIIF